MELFKSGGHVNVNFEFNALKPTHHFSFSPFHLTSLRPFRFPAPLTSKKSSFQDFQDYAKPRRLLPTQQLNIFREETISALQSDGSISFYKVLLCTSCFYGSDLSDQTAGILVCIIDEHGDSVLERIPAILKGSVQQCEDDVTSNVIRFQRGSKDEFIFWGPKLGRIQAMWISLDSGSWRLSGASLTIIDAYNHQGEEYSANGSMYRSTTYNFEVDDVLLGEGSDLSMAELRPCLVTENLGADSSSIFDESTAKAASVAEKEIAKEESLREYAILKYSLLLYDSILIVAGTYFASVTGGKNTALAFLTGGIGGFFYLLLLQRSVDTLPAPEMNVTASGNSFDSLSGGVKGPTVVFAFLFLVAVLAMKNDKSDVIAALTPGEILAGMLGFLACKVSVVLAAFKPISMGLEDDD